jgi:hypothetical protein
VSNKAALLGYGKMWSPDDALLGLWLRLPYIDSWCMEKIVGIGIPYYNNIATSVQSEALCILEVELRRVV